MWQRTTNPKNAKYPTYKCRVPPESWKDFEVFYACMGPKPSWDYTLERVDNDKPYGPDNCIWIPADEQGRNTSKVRRFLLYGKECILSDLERRYGISHGAFSHRHYTNKESVHSIFGLSESQLQEIPKQPKNFDQL